MISHALPWTIVLWPLMLLPIALLGAVFLKGFKEAIGIAVAVLVGYPWQAWVWVPVMTLIIGVVFLRDTLGVDLRTGSGVAIQKGVS